MTRALVLAGPTGAGKTALSLVVARAFDAVVVSADAMQVYRGFDIGTGKVTPAERAVVSHYAIDVVDAEQPFDAADFIAIADAAIAAHPRVIVAGGTSLYLQALVRGLVQTPPIDAGLRAELAAKPDLHGSLANVDPELAARLHPNDRVRVSRGLEVYLQTGQRLSELQRAHAEQPDRVATVARWVDRDDLEARIDARVHEMIAAGYVDEAGGLLNAGVSRLAKPMMSLGYRHLAEHLLDDLPRDEAIRRTQRDSRQLARKQRNWMRVLRYPRIVGDDVDAAMAAAEAAFGGGA